MTKKVAVLLKEGFEEAEAVMVINVLRRLNINVELLSCQDRLELRSAHQIRMFANVLLERRDDVLYDAVIIPGGEAVAISPQVASFLRRHDSANKLICPLGSAAAYVLAPHKLLKGRRYAGDAELAPEITDGVYAAQKRVVDGNLISGQGVNAAFDLALYIAPYLTDNNDEQQALANQLLLCENA